MLRGDLKLLDQLPRSSRLAEAVIHSYHAHDGRLAIELLGTADHGRHLITEPPDLVLLGRHHYSRVCGGLHYSRPVEGLDRVDVHDTGLDVVLVLEDPGRPHGLGNRGAARDDRKILVLVRILRGQRVLECVLELRPSTPEPDDVCLTPFVGGLLVRHDRGRLAREPQVLRALDLEEQVLGSALRLDGIARHLDVHVGNAAHLKQLLERLVRRAVRADRNATVRPGDHHVELAVAHRRSQLVQVPSGREDAIGPEDGELPLPREPGGDAGS